MCVREGAGCGENAVSLGSMSHSSGFVPLSLSPPSLLALTLGVPVCPLAYCVSSMPNIFLAIFCRLNALYAGEVKWRHLTLSAVIEMQQLSPLISLSGAIKLRQDLGSSQAGQYFQPRLTWHTQIHRQNYTHRPHAYICTYTQR